MERASAGPVGGWPPALQWATAAVGPGAVRGAWGNAIGHCLWGREPSAGEGHGLGEEGGDLIYLYGSVAFMILGS